MASVFRQAVEEESDESDGETEPTEKEKTKIAANYAKCKIRELVRLPDLPLVDRKNTSAMVQLVKNFRNGVEECRRGCSDVHLTLWNSAWLSTAEKYVLSAVTHTHLPSHLSKSEQESLLTDARDQIGEVFSEAAGEADSITGPEQLELVVRGLTRTMSDVTPAGVIAELSNFVVDSGTPYDKYLSKLKVLVVHAKGLGLMAPQDSAMQMSVWSSMADQFQSIAGLVFQGKNPGEPPFASVEMLLSKMTKHNWQRDTASEAKRGGTKTNRKVAETSSAAKGSGGSSRSYSFRQRSAGGNQVMHISGEMEEEEEEFVRVYTVMREGLPQTRGRNI